MKKQSLFLGLSAIATLGLIASNTSMVLASSAAPADLCSTYKHGDLSANLDGNHGNAVFTNHSKVCSYKIGLASYQVFKNTDMLYGQEVFDYASAYIGPNQIVTLKVNLPTCAYQIDPFEGEVITKFSPTEKYGPQGRLLGAGWLHVGGRKLCEKVTATPTPTPTATPTPKPTATPTPKPTTTPSVSPTPTTTPAPTATPTPAPTGQVLAATPTPTPVAPVQLPATGPGQTFALALSGLVVALITKKLV